MAPLPQPAKCSAPYSPALPVSLPISSLPVSTASTAYAAPLFNAAVLPSRASTNIDVDALEAQLSILPNQHFVNALINGLRYGFHIGFSSPRFSVCAPNRPSALEHREVVAAAIAKEVERGHTVGPFPTPPFPVFACSPLGCVPKKPDSWRLILDLSAPAGCSVNDGIPVEHGAVQYVRFDQIIRMIAQLGRGALIAKVDLKHAFRQCPVHPDDWPLLCYKWEDQYYVDVRLPFGLRSSPALFNKLAEGLCCLLRTKGISHLEHYLDDFVTAGPPDSPICLAHQQLILRTFDQVGVLASPDKTLGPSTCLPVLGIEIDTVAWETRLPPEKVEEYAQILAAWRLRSSATKRELDSLTGILFYACRVVIPGRPFVNRIVDCGRHARLPCHFIRVTKEARQDIAWWDALLNQWNGRSLFYDLDWASASDLSLFTDASGRLGFGAVFGSQWFSGEWTQDTVSHSIHWQELFAIYAALLAWGSQWRGKRVLFQCDNEGVVSSLNNGRCADSESLVLLRHISFLCCLNDCWVGAEHLPGHSNVLADALSRLQVQKFRQLCPQAAPSPTPIPAVAMRPWLLSYNDYRKLVSPPRLDGPTLAVKPLT